MKHNVVYLCVISVIFQIFSVAFAAEPFRFALFTDMHISKKNPIIVVNFKKAIDEVNTLSGIDFVLVTGDETESGDIKSLLDTKRILDRLKMPYYLTAGNHEFKDNSAKDSNFIRVFGDDKFSFVHKDVMFIGFTIGIIPKIGTGRITQQNINWLKSVLINNEKKIPVIVVTHYPLRRGVVSNSKMMIDIFQKYDVNAVLGGHYHRNMLLYYNRIPGIIHRSFKRGKKDLGAYSILSISDSITVFEKKIGQPERKWLVLPIEKRLNTMYYN